MKKLIPFLMIAALCAPALADEGAVSAGRGGPVFPTSTIDDQAKDVATVLLNNADVIARQLADNALLGRVKVVNGGIQQKQPLGKDDRTYGFGLRECAPGIPGGCVDAGWLEIKQSTLPGGNRYSVDLQLR